MKVVVGLGNPGSKYQVTKHNCGFMVLDEIAYREKSTFNKEQFTADTSEFFLNGEKIILVKPLTFMNESGRAVAPLLDYYRVAIEDLLVIYDDLDLNPGTIRLRTKGSAGGHNGVKSLQQYLANQPFNRIRVGIGRPLPGQTVVSHVLSPFAKDIYPEMNSAIKKAADAALFWCSGQPFSEAMNRYNSKKE